MPAASTIGNTALVSEGRRQHDLLGSLPRAPPGRCRPSRRVPTPRRCQAGSTHRSTGHASPSCCGRLFLPSALPTRPRVERRHDAVSVADVVGIAGARAGGGPGGAWAAQGPGRPAPPARRPAPALGRGEGRVAPDLDGRRSADRHLEHVRRTAARGAMSGAEEVGGHVGEGRRLDDDLRRTAWTYLVGWSSSACRLTCVGDDGARPGTGARGATISASPHASGVRTTSSTVAVPGTLAARTPGRRRC